MDNGPTITSSFDLNYFSKASSPNTATLGDRASTYEFGARQGCGQNPTHGAAVMVKVRRKIWARERAGDPLT